MLKGVRFLGCPTPKYKSERNDLFNILAKEVKDWNNLSTMNRFIQIMKITIQVIKTGQFIHHIINFDCK